MRRPSATTAALAIFGVLVAACALPDISVGGPTDPVTPTATPTSDPDPSASRESLEGQFTFDTMDEYVERVVGGLINPWMSETWPRLPLPDVVYVADRRTVRTGCVDEDGRQARATGDSYEYCPPDRTVYLGQSTLWTFYRRTGDAGPALGIAHEFGHHVQYELDIPAPFTSQESIEFENQADCLAGTWARYADAKGWLETDVQSPNGRSDLEDIELLFPLIASAEGEDRDHGTQEEREQAFTDGYLIGLAGCDL